MRSDVGVIDLAGEIDEDAALRFQLQCRSIPDSSKRVSVLILRLSSKGGTLGAAQAITEAMQIVRSETGAPWIVTVTDVALSAGFYVALEADHLMATPAAMLGNVGAVVRLPNFSNVLERLGVDYHLISPNRLKGAFDNFGELDETKLASINEFCSDQSEQFLSYIQGKRSPSEETLGWLRTGRVFSGKDAASRGIVDSLGSFLMAIGKAGELAGVDAPRLVQIAGPKQPLSVRKFAFNAVRRILS